MPQKPVWTEGILISQHHFQQSDRYHEQALDMRVRAIAHYGWGVVKLQVDVEALALNRLRISAFECVWPDGTLICWGPGHPGIPPPAREIPATDQRTAERLEVRLTLEEPRSGGASLMSAETPGARFVRRRATVADVNTGASDMELEWAEPRVRLLLGDEEADGAQTLRVAQLSRDSSGRLQLYESCSPPALHLAAAPGVVAALQRVVTAAAARRSELAAEHGQRHGARLDFHAASSAGLWLLHTLSGALPLLRHLASTPRAHPEEAYLALVTLVGHLTAFWPAPSLPAVPGFDYLELGATFEELCACAIGFIQSPLEKPHTELPLRQRASKGLNLHLCEPEDKSLLDRPLFVAVRSDQPMALLRERIPALLKVASPEQIIRVLQEARHGVKLTPEWNPSPALPLNPDVCFFRVSQSGQDWDEVNRSGSIALALPDDTNWRGTELSLFALADEPGA